MKTWSVRDLISQSERDWSSVDGEIVTVAGYVRVTSAFSVLSDSESSDDAIVLFGGQLYWALRGRLECRHGLMVGYIGNAEVTGTAETNIGLTQFRVGLHSIQSFTFDDGEQSATVESIGEAFDREEIEVLAENVLRWPDRPLSPMLTVDIGTLWNIQEQANRIVPVNDSERYLVSQVNRLWERLREGLQSQGLWGNEENPVVGNSLGDRSPPKRA